MTWLCWMLWCLNPSIGEIFLPSSMSRLSLDSTQLPYSVGARRFSLAVKQLGHDSDHSPLSSMEVNNEWSCASFHLYDFITCTVKTLGIFSTCTVNLVQDFETSYAYIYTFIVIYPSSQMCKMRME